MTEAAWLACTDPRPMLEFLRDQASDRKLRLFACGCCRHVWDWLGEKSRHAIAMRSEATVSKAQECARACQRALEAFEQEKSWLPWERRSAHWWSEMRERIERTMGCERWYQADLVRCIAGNSFRPVAFDPARVTPDVLGLARVIYNDREFDRMSDLADAAEEAGCVNADILKHCRGPGPHAKGCWVIDLVLGKS